MNDFGNIDSIINLFRKDKHGIKISTKAKSDWCVFEYRSIKWSNNGIIHLIEVFPKLNGDCSYNKWYLTALSHYDENARRYFERKTLLEPISFKELENQLIEKLITIYIKLNQLSKKDISEFIELKN